MPIFRVALQLEPMGEGTAAGAQKTHDFEADDLQHAESTLLSDYYQDGWFHWEANGRIYRYNERYVVSYEVLPVPDPTKKGKSVNPLDLMGR